MAEFGNGLNWKEKTLSHATEDVLNKLVFKLSQLVLCHGVFFLLVPLLALSINSSGVELKNDRKLC